MSGKTDIWVLRILGVRFLSYTYFLALYSFIFYIFILQCNAPCTKFLFFVYNFFKKQKY